MHTRNSSASQTDRTSRFGLRTHRSDRGISNRHVFGDFFCRWQDSAVLPHLYSTVQMETVLFGAGRCSGKISQRNHASSTSRGCVWLWQNSFGHPGSQTFVSEAHLPEKRVIQAFIGVRFYVGSVLGHTRLIIRVGLLSKR